MARQTGNRPVPPRLPAEMPSEPDLSLTGGGEVNGITIQGDFSDTHLENLVVEDSHIVDSSFIAADLGRLRLMDVLVERTDFSGADMEEASFTRVIFMGCRMSGALLPRTQLRDVTFSEVRLDDGNFRMSTGERILFDDVNLQRADFYSSSLVNTSFFDCDMGGVDVSQAKLPEARFHGSVLRDIKGGEHLRDIVIDTSQVLPLAIGVFAGLNIRVEEDRYIQEG